MTFDPKRRRFLKAGAASLATLPLAGCFDVAGDRDSTVRKVLMSANDLTYRVQRFLLNADALAQEFPATEIRQPMRPNGVTNPQDADYRALAANDFADYRLTIDGLVERPRQFGLAEIRSMSGRTQITRHDCVEGWSCIAMWTGVPLSYLLQAVGVRPTARYAVFSCFDTLENGFTGPIRYYESIDLRDAYHPQTILAHAMNGQKLPIANGAPLRLRVERQLGYKMAKYIHTITLTDSLAGFGEGSGGYWEDRGYEWFAGI